MGSLVVVKVSLFCVFVKVKLLNRGCGSWIPWVAIIAIDNYSKSFSS